MERPKAGELGILSVVHHQILAVRPLFSLQVRSIPVNRAAAQIERVLSFDSQTVHDG